MKQEYTILSVRQYNRESIDEASGEVKEQDRVWVELLEDDGFSCSLKQFTQADLDIEFAQGKTVVVEFHEEGSKVRTKTTYNADGEPTLGDVLFVAGKRMIKSLTKFISQTEQTVTDTRLGELKAEHEFKSRFAAKRTFQKIAKEDPIPDKEIEIKVAAEEKARLEAEAQELATGMDEKETKAKTK